MRIGIDFDNTIVCYDQLFWTLARDRGVIDESIKCRKDAVRDNLRQRGHEAVWTSLQAEAYGSRILDASPFPGVRSALEEFHRRQWTVVVISHKTKSPFAGPDCDLHAAARNWLIDRGFLDVNRTGLEADAVFLELTKQEKLNRIAQTGCDVFIDDLPELLSDSDFPSHVDRVLFDPHRQHGSMPGIRCLHNWNDAVSVLTSEASG